jgi:hypothetical protein
LIRALAWPATIILVVLIFHKQLSAFLGGIGQRVKKLSVFEFALELAAVPEFTTTWSAPALSDVRQLESCRGLFFVGHGLFDQIRYDAASDFAVVDLGSGTAVADSRLFIFTVLLQRMSK